MEIIKVKDSTGGEVILEISPVELKQQQGWKLNFEDGREAVLVVDQHGIWKEAGNNLEPEFVSKLGAAIDEKITGNG